MGRPGRPIRDLEGVRGRVTQTFQMDVALADVLNKKAYEAGVTKRQYVQALLVMVRDGDVDPTPVFEAQREAAALTGA